MQICRFRHKANKPELKPKVNELSSQGRRKGCVSFLPADENLDLTVDGFDKLTNCLPGWRCTTCGQEINKEKGSTMIPDPSIFISLAPLLGPN